MSIKKLFCQLVSSNSYGCQAPPVESPKQGVGGEVGAYWAALDAHGVETEAT